MPTLLPAVVVRVYPTFAAFAAPWPPVAVHEDGPVLLASTKASVARSVARSVVVLDVPLFIIISVCVLKAFLWDDCQKEF